MKHKKSKWQLKGWWFDFSHLANMHVPQVNVALSLMDCGPVGTYEVVRP